jgi:hypothetical protein
VKRAGPGKKFVYLKRVSVSISTIAGKESTIFYVFIRKKVERKSGLGRLGLRRWNVEHKYPKLYKSRNHGYSAQNNAEFLAFYEFQKYRKLFLLSNYCQVFERWTCILKNHHKLFLQKKHW